MAKLITVYWRDIPAQVIAKAGRKTAKIQLSQRFLDAIDMAAMRAGKGSTDEYLEDWRREQIECSDDLQTEAQAAADKLEAMFQPSVLQQYVKHHGLQSPDATDT